MLLQFLVVIVFFQKNTFSQVIHQNFIVQIDGKRDSLLKIWKADSLGCLGLRTEEFANLLIDSFELVTKNSQEIIDFLGKPNKIYTDDSIISIRYYTNSYCDINMLTSDKLVHCAMDFYFRNKKVNSWILIPFCY